MPQDIILAQDPQILGEDGKIDLARCRALAAHIAELAQMGVILSLAARYEVGSYRYTSLGDALAQVRRAQSAGGGL